MKECIINFDEIETIEEMHEAFAKQLDFPEWYGRNYDALYDMLSSINEETTIRIYGWNKIGHDHFAHCLVDVLVPIMFDNDNVEVIDMDW